MEWIPSLGQFLFLLAAGGALLAYWIKAINWSKGYGFTPFGLRRDLHVFTSIMKNEKDVHLQRRYRLIQWAFYVCAFIGLVTVFALGVFLLTSRYFR